MLGAHGVLTHPTDHMPCSAWSHDQSLKLLAAPARCRRPLTRRYTRINGPLLPGGCVAIRSTSSGYMVAIPLPPFDGRRFCR